jgi:hypothetical protein
MRRSLCCLVGVFVLGAPLAGVTASGAEAAHAPIVVTTDEDVVDPGDGVVSLREAIDVANAAPGPDTIDIDGRMVELTLCGDGTDTDEQTNASGDLDSTGDLTLTDGGIQACWFQRVLDQSDKPLTIVSLTIDGGEAAGDGGGIRSRGPVRLAQSTVRNSVANRDGGGIYAPSVVARGSTIVGNESYGGSGGGGIHATGAVRLVDTAVTGNTSTYGTGGGGVHGGAVTIVRSTLWHNGAEVFGRAVGGAVVAESSLRVVDSTISDNQADARAGGLWSAGRVELVRSTVVRNQAPVAANLVVLGPFRAQRTVLGEPHGGGGNCVLRAAASSGGFNVVSVGGRCGLGGGPGDRTNRETLGLWPLADNGGPTPTHLPLGPSLSIIWPDRCGASADQRGQVRPQGSFCEAGAVEVP